MELAPHAPHGHHHPGVGVGGGEAAKGSRRRPLTGGRARPLDDAKARAFGARMLAALDDSALCVLIALGHSLGLWEALAAAGAATASASSPVGSSGGGAPPP